MSVMTVQQLLMLATDRLVDPSNLLRFDNVIEFTSGYKHFIYAVMKVKNVIFFQIYFSDSILTVHLEISNVRLFSVNLRSIQTQIIFFSIDWLGLKQYRA